MLESAARDKLQQALLFQRERALVVGEVACELEERDSYDMTREKNKVKTMRWVLVELMKGSRKACGQNYLLS